MLRQTLFSPQYAADIFGITASVPARIPVPAFEKATLDFGTYASYETIRDVRVELSGDTSVSMDQLSDTVYEFGPFESLDEVPISITFVDPATNATTYQSALAPYTPSIHISEATSADDSLVVVGYTDSSSLDIPAQIYRYDTIDPQPLVDTHLRFDENGAYRLSISQTNAYFILMDGTTKVLRIDKRTGHIRDIDTSYSVNFVSTTSDKPSHFVVEDSQSNTIYEWHYQLSDPVLAQIGE